MCGCRYNSSAPALTIPVYFPFPFFQIARRADLLMWPCFESDSPAFFTNKFREWHSGFKYNNFWSFQIIVNIITVFQIGVFEYFFEQFYINGGIRYFKKWWYIPVNDFVKFPVFFHKPSLFIKMILLFKGFCSLINFFYLFFNGIFFHAQ